MTRFSGFAVLLSLASASAGELVLPSQALARSGAAHLIYRTNGQATGSATLSMRWTDALGRVVEDRKIAFELTDETDLGFDLDLRRAAAMANEVKVHFSFLGVNKKGARDAREEDAAASFVARPPDGRWWDYHIIMWQPYPREAVAGLKTIGIDGGQFVGRNRNLPEFLLANDLRWYAENIATDFYSAYHRYRPDRPVNWAFFKAKELYKKDPHSREPFKRRPSLSDAVWLRKIHDRLVDAAQRLSPYRPFFYSLGDESGIADLSAFWDFDFSDQSLEGMRRWLESRYGTLAALNRQWGTNFPSWDLVVPETTNQAMQRSDENYSSWADFKEWMDIAFAEALKMGADAVHSVDPEAYVGIGGGQMPGWGGYDYYRLTRALTAIEPYDIGNNIEIIRSLNPRMAVLTTAFARGPWEKHRVWYELLHGNRGLILWDDKHEFANPDGTLGPRGREVAPYYQEIRNGLGALLINSRRMADPVAIHYSQTSLRTAWMLTHRAQGDAWVTRGSAIERKDSDFLRLRESWCRLIEDQGLQYNFVAYGQMEQGELLRGGYRVLILPDSNSLSALEARAIREFVEQGGTVLTGSEPGVFDEHSRRLAQPQLRNLFANPPGRGKALYVRPDVLSYHQDRLVHKEGAAYHLVGGLLRATGVRPGFALSDDSGQAPVGVETHVFANGGVRIVGLLGNPQLRVDELGPPEFKSNERFEKPRTVRLTLPEEAYVYDLRAGKPLGRQKELRVPLDPYEPGLFAVSPAALPKLEVRAPARIALGETGQISLRLGDTPAVTDVLHVDVAEPSGKTVLPYSGNVRVTGGAAQWPVPLARNDPAGRWQVRVKDLLTGQVETATIDVR